MIRSTQKRKALRRKREEKSWSHWLGSLKPWVLAGDVDETISLTNVENTYFTAPFFMANNLEQVNVIFDTTEDRMIIESHECTDCLGTPFDFTTEAGGTFEKVAAGTLIERVYKDVTYTAEEAKVQVCAANDSLTCIDEFELLIA